MAKVLGKSECKSRSLAMFFQVVGVLLSHFAVTFHSRRVFMFWLKTNNPPARFLQGGGAMATFTTEQFGE